jgi:hypothetical protein
MALNKEGEREFVPFLPELVEKESILPTRTSEVGRLGLLSIPSVQKRNQIKKGEFLILQHWNYILQHNVLQTAVHWKCVFISVVIQRYDKILM